MAVKKSPKKAVTKTKVSAAKTRKTPAIQKKYTKTEILNEISENTSVSKKEVAAVLEDRESFPHCLFLSGLLKIKSVQRPARPARKNVPNPFRPGELMDIPRKPASTRVKVLPLKKLKEFAL